MADSNIRQEVSWFAEAMERKLQENDFKGGWKECSLPFLVIKLVEETHELLRALDYDAIEILNLFLQESRNTSKGSIAEEAADVGNIAMMIRDNFGEQNNDG